MKKTLIALMALAGVATAANGDLTELYDFKTLAALGSATGTVAEDSTTYDQTVYTCTGAQYYTDIESESIAAILGDTTGTKTLTIAAWIKVPSANSTLNYTLFTWGDDNEAGVKVGVDYYQNDWSVFSTAKYKAVQKQVIYDVEVSNGEITSTSGTNPTENWTLIAVSLTRTGDTFVDMVIRDITDSKSTDIDNQAIAKPSDNTIGLLTCKGSGEGSETFVGSFGAYKIFSSTGGADAVTEEAIKTAMGAAPKSIPEPTTATLSLLALAGLAARRRRR